MKLKRRENLRFFSKLCRGTIDDFKICARRDASDRYPYARIMLHNTQLRSITSRLLVHTCPEVRSPAAYEFSNGKPELFSDANSTLR